MDPFFLAAMVLMAMAMATLAASGLARAGFPLPGGQRIGEIDGLRGYLALAVMGHHFTIWLSTMAGNPWRAPELAFYNQLGKTGVAMFFMITGILFYPRIAAGIARTSWVSLYIGRIFRIVPLQVVMTLIVTAIVMVETGRVPTRGYLIDLASWVVWPPRPLLGDAFTRTAIGGVLWSIWYEWLFYVLVLPACALARGLVGRRTWLVPIALMAISLIGRLTPEPLFTYAPLFAFGMLAHEIRERPQLAQRLLGPLPAALALLTLVVNMVCFRDPYGIAMPLIAFTFTAVACGNSLFGLLAQPGARMLGELSYGIYLLHSVVLYIGFKTLTDFATGMPWLALPVMTMILVPITAATYLAVERPCNSIGRWIAARLTARPARIG